MTKQASSQDYWQCLSRIDRLSRNKLREKEHQTVVYGSELSHIINIEIPRNPIRIMREASRLAKEAGLEGADYWHLSSEGAQLCSLKDKVNFRSDRRDDVSEVDADKLAALDLLAKVCEYVKNREK